MAGLVSSRTAFWTTIEGTYDGITRDFVVFYPWLMVNHGGLGLMWEPRQDEQNEAEKNHTLSPHSNILYPSELVFVESFDNLGRDKDSYPVHGGNVTPRDLFPNAV